MWQNKGHSKTDTRRVCIQQLISTANHDMGLSSKRVKKFIHFRFRWIWNCQIQLSNFILQINVSLNELSVSDRQWQHIDSRWLWPCSHSCSLTSMTWVITHVCFYHSYTFRTFNNGNNPHHKKHFMVGDFQIFHSIWLAQMEMNCPNVSEYESQ